MPKVDKDLLVRVGLGTMRSDLIKVALKTFYEMLELRVGIDLANRMTNEELDEFEVFFEAGDDGGAFEWLSEHFPDYPEVVQAAYGRLEAEAAEESVAVMEGLDALLVEFGQQPSSTNLGDPTSTSREADSSAQARPSED